MVRLAESVRRFLWSLINLISVDTYMVFYLEDFRAEIASKKWKVNAVLSELAMPYNMMQRLFDQLNVVITAYSRK